MEPYPKIQSVTPLADFHLLVCFRNGVEKVYDCRPILRRPEFFLLNTPAFFRAVRVDVGGYGVIWNDDLDLAESELWTNSVDVKNCKELYPEGLCSARLVADGESGDKEVRRS